MSDIRTSKKSVRWNCKKMLENVEKDQFWNAIVYQNRIERDLIYLFDAVLKNNFSEKEE